MKVIYNTIVDTIIDLNAQAAMDNRSIKRIILTDNEAKQLRAEVCIGCNGVLDMIDGIPLEVE